MTQPVTDPAPKPGPPATGGPASAQTEPAAKTEPAAEEKQFTQADIDRIVGQRLAPYKEKADAFDKATEAAKTEAQKQADAMAAMKAENDRYKASEARRKAALDAKLPVAAIDLVTGDTPEQIDASIKALQALISETGIRTPAPDPTQGRVPQGNTSGDWLRDSITRR